MKGFQISAFVLFALLAIGVLCLLVAVFPVMSDVIRDIALYGWFICWFSAFVFGCYDE